MQGHEPIAKLSERCVVWHGRAELALLLLLPDPFRGMGACRKTMEPQNPGNSPGPGPEVVKRRRVTKERAAQRVRGWAGFRRLKRQVRGGC